MRVVSWLALAAVGCTITVEPGVPGPGPGSGPGPGTTSPTTTSPTTTSPTTPGTAPSGSGPCGGACGFQLDTVDRASGVWATFDAAMGPDGTVHVVLYDAAGDEFRYVTSDGWAAEVLQPGGVSLLPAHAAIGVGSDGGVHVLLSSQGATYLERQASGWLADDLGGTPLGGLVDQPALLAMDGSMPLLFVGRDSWFRDGSGWAEGPKLPWGTRQVGVDAAGTLHAVWGSESLLHSTLIGGSWRDVEIIDAASDDVSIAFDGAGAVHLGLELLHDDSELWHGWTEADRWELEAVESLGDVGDGVSIAVDPSDQVWMSYAARGNGTLMFAWRTASGFETQEVIVGGSVLRTELLIDPVTSVPVIVWLDNTRGEIRVARGVPTP